MFDGEILHQKKQPIIFPNLTSSWLRSKNENQTPDFAACDIEQGPTQYG